MFSKWSFPFMVLTKIVYAFLIPHVSYKPYYQTRLDFIILKYLVSTTHFENPVCIDFSITNYVFYLRDKYFLQHPVIKIS